MRRIHADLLLVLAAAVWGFAFLFQKSAMLHMGPLLFIASRATVATLALAPIALVEARQRGAPDTMALARTAVPAGVAFFIAAALQQWGLVTASVTNTGFLTALYVVATPFVAWAWLGHAPARLIWPAAALSAIGTWLLGGGTLGAFGFGDGLVALCAVFWGVHVVATRRGAGLDRPAAFTAAQFATVAVLALAFAVPLETIGADSLVAAWREILYVGLLSSALTFTLLTVALRYTGASEATIIVSTESLFAAFGAWLLLGERLPWIGWIGAALILAAVLLIQLAPAKDGAPE